MAYVISIKKDDALRVKKDGVYPWPTLKCVPPEPDRTIELFTDDVLTKGADGTYTVHTGICCFNIVLKDDEVEPWGRDVNLRIS